MTEDEARRLATRIIDTWPSGAHAYIWRDALIGLDHHAADVTYRQLMVNATHPPTPGTFLIAYRQTRARLTEQHHPGLFDEPENVIGMAEYRARLEQHPSVHGDTLDHWRKAWRLGDVIEALNNKDHHP